MHTISSRGRTHAFPLIVQRHAGACGAAVVEAMLKHYGVETSRRAQPRDFASLDDMSRALARSGLPARVGRLRSDIADAVPFIALLRYRCSGHQPDEWHYVNVCDVADDDVRISDPTGRQYTLSRGALAACWTGIAIVPRPRTARVRRRKGGKR